MSEDGRKRPRRAAADAGREDGFLARWSRLKRRPEAAEAEKAAPATAERPAAADKALPDTARRSDEEVLAELDLPAPELLGRGEIRDFLKAPITESLRRRALRRLWQLDPVLANLDGLVDYGEDFTGQGVVTGIVETAFRVGRGMVEAAEEETVKESADATRPAPAPEGAAPEGAPAAGGGPVMVQPPVAKNPAPTGTDSPVAAQEGEEAAHGQAPSPAEEPPLPRPRRMRFRPA